MKQSAKENKSAVNKMVPDNATNGEVIQLLFPNVETGSYSQNAITFFPVLPNGFFTEIHFDKDWWNAPYEKAQ